MISKKHHLSYICMIDPESIVYKPFCGLPAELLYYVLQFLDLATVHGLRLVDKSLYGICTGSYMRRILYPKALEDFDDLCKNCTTEEDLDTPWWSIYRSAFEAMHFYRKNPQKIPHGVLCVTHLPQNLYDAQKWDSVLGWIERFYRTKTFLADAEKHIRNKKNSVSKRLNKKKGTFKCSKHEKTTTRLTREIKALKKQYGELSKLYSLLNSELNRIIIIGSSITSMMMRIPKTWFENPQEYPQQMHDKMVSTLFSCFSSGDTFSKKQILAVYKLMMDDARHFILAFVNGYIVRITDYCDVLASLDRTDLLVSLGHEGFGINRRFEVLQKAAENHTCPNLCKWLFEKFGYVARQLLESMTSKEAVAAYERMSEKQARVFTENLVLWDYPSLFQTLFDTSDDFVRNVSFLADKKETIEAFMKWDIMPCSFYVLCSMINDKVSTHNRSLWRKAFKPVLRDSKKTWDDVYYCVKHNDTRSRNRLDLLQRVCIISKGKLSTSTLKEHCETLFKQNSYHAVEALEIACQTECWDPLDLIVNVRAPDSNLSDVLRSVHPRHFETLMDRALETEYVCLVITLLRLSYIPSIEQYKKVRTMKGEAANLIRVAFVRASTQFVVE